MIKFLSKMRDVFGLKSQVKNLENNINRDISSLKIMMGKLLSNNAKELRLLENIQEAEFKVFSQWGDDGIIQYLINNVSIDNETFVEFGVENYLESNTRFLLMNNNWKGLVLDGSKENIKFIKSDEIYWKYDLQAVHAFVTAENIDGLLSAAGFQGDVGLLHIDIDGNDYWIWKAIEQVRATIVIVEYNSLFGNDRPITIPYDPGFQRHVAHHSGLYAGCSLMSLYDLAEAKGYAFVGSNSAGNNAYFVRKDRIGILRPLTPREGYVKSRFREHRDGEGRLTFLSGDDAVETIRGLPVYNTRSNTVEVL